MNCQPEGFQPGLHLSFRHPQSALVMSEKQQVVHVTDIAGTSQLAFHEVIHRIEQHIRPELARQVTDRQPTRPVDGKEIIPGEVHHVVGIGEHALTALQDLVDQGQDGGVRELTREKLAQDRMVDAREELAEVELEDVGKPPAELLTAVQRSVGPLAAPVGIAVGNEPFFENRLDHVEQSMVDDPVAEGRGADQPALRLMNVEACVSSGQVGLSDEIPTQRRQVVFEAVLKGGDVRLPPLAAGGVAEGAEEIRPGGQLLKQGVEVKSAPPQGAPRGRGRCYVPGPGRPERGQERAPPFFASARKSQKPRRTVPACWKNVSTTTRNPMLSLRLPGSFLLRYAQRAFLVSLK